MKLAGPFWSSLQFSIWSVIWSFKKAAKASLLLLLVRPEVRENSISNHLSLSKDEEDDTGLNDCSSLWSSANLYALAD